MRREIVASFLQLSVALLCLTELSVGLSCITEGA